MISYFEKLFFAPRGFDYIIIVLLLPLSLAYGIVSWLLKLFKRPKSYGIKVISIGNLTVGGSGKTPFAIALINHLESKGFKNIYYISRGFGRKSNSLVGVKLNGKIICSVEESGDEAMLVAKECSGCSVVVSENRKEAIELAKNKGASLIILDDAFSKVDIEKFDILLEPKNLPNRFVLPAGPFREFSFAKSRADIVLKEGIDFNRKISFENLSSSMLLVTSIANPKRLDKFLPVGVVGKYYLKDHAYFEKDKILEEIKKYNVQTILVTQKDFVKLEQFKLPVSIIKLKLDINFKALNEIENYISKDET